MGKYLRIIFPIAVLASSCFLGFAFKYHIVKDYYLIAVDTKYDLTICKKNKDSYDGYSGKMPSRVIQYGYNDSLIIALVEDLHLSQKKYAYYILNMNKDTDYAKEKDYLEGPITPENYNNNWRNRIILHNIKDIDSSMGGD